MYIPATGDSETNVEIAKRWKAMSQEDKDRIPGCSILPIPIVRISPPQTRF